MVDFHGCISCVQISGKDLIMVKTHWTLNRTLGAVFMGTHLGVEHLLDMVASLSSSDTIDVCHNTSCYHVIKGLGLGMNLES